VAVRYRIMAAMAIMIKFIGFGILSGTYIPIYPRVIQHPFTR
jgi:hypothetical protein